MTIDPPHEADRLREEISELRDLITSLSLSVEYSTKEPFEAFLAHNGIAGRQRSALQLALAALLSRAEGTSPHPLSDNTLLELESFAEPLKRAHNPPPVAKHEALEILGAILGSTERAEQALAAHRARGFALRAHAALDQS